MEISVLHPENIAGATIDKRYSAAEYVRMSTDHQQYSTANQSQAIREYAARNGFRIERTYTDSGKSGLNLEDRDALKELIDDVQSGNTEYSTTLCTTSAVGEDSRMPMKAPITNISANALAFQFAIVPNNLKMTGVQSRQL